MPVREQAVDQGGSDESGNSGDQCAHRPTLPGERSCSSSVQSRPDELGRRTAVALIVVQLVIRAVLAFGGYFYWDDLILVGRAGTQRPAVPAYLFDDHDGHVMPGAFLVAGGITRLAPLNWVGPAISLVVLQLLASLALLRALQVILGWRPVLLVPLTFALFTPLGVPGFAWWAAGLNSLPMLAALAWVCADAILLVRTGNQRYAVSGCWCMSAACCSSRSLRSFRSSPSRWRRCWPAYRRTGAREVWRRGFRLWSALAVTAAWIGVYLMVVDQQRWSAGPRHDVGSAAAFGHPRHRARAGRRAVGLAALGAGVAVGDPAVTVMVLGWLALAAVMAVRWSARSASARCGWPRPATRWPARCRFT